jgi:phage gp45-like
MVSVSDIRRLMKPLSGRLKGMIRRATLGTLNTSTLAQSVQAGTTKDDEDDEVELFEPFGFTAGPPAGSEGIVLRVGGERAGSVAICFGNRTNRLSGVNQNESALYNLLASIVLRVSGNVEVNPGPAALIQLGGPTVTEPVVLGLQLQTALNTYAGAITAANAALDTAATTWAAIVPPTVAGNNAFAAAFTAWNTATAAAQTALATALAAALSQTTFTA